jgi:hypothetical protein
LAIVITALLILAPLLFAYYLLSLYCARAYLRGAHKASTPKVLFVPRATIGEPVRGLGHQAGLREFR